MKPVKNLNRKIQLVLFLHLALQLFACNPAQPPEPVPSATNVLEPTTTSVPASDLPVRIELNQPFSLMVNQKGTLEMSSLTIQLQTVLNDWRCPSQVNCASAGNATVVITVGLTGQEPTRFEVNINPPPFERDVLYDAYQIQLLKLDPYPEIIDQSIPQEEYQATLVVSPAPPPTAEPTAAPTPTDPPVTLVEPDNSPSKDGPSLEAENHYYKGLAMVASGLPDEAIVSLTEAITLYPAYIEAYQIRGDAYRDLRRYDLARADYQQVLALNPAPEMQATVTAAFQEIAEAKSVLPTATITPTPAPATPLPSPPVAITLDEPFSLALNQYGRLDPTELGVEFYEVIEDTRCPRAVAGSDIQVLCESEGWARITIFVWFTNVEPIELELNTDPSANKSVALYDEYQIQLLSLDPYPETPEPKIALEDYRATFVVSKE